MQRAMDLTGGRGYDVVLDGSGSVHAAASLPDIGMPIYDAQDPNDDVYQVTRGVMDTKPSAPLGHRTSGTIVEIGEKAAAAGYKVGDKVALFPVSHCGECKWCDAVLHQHKAHQRVCAIRYNRRKDDL